MKLLIFLLTLQIIFSYLQFPFTIKKNEKYNDPEAYIKQYQHNNITITLSLGTPIQNLPINLKLQKYPFFISSYQTDLPIEKFNENKSSSFEEIEKKKTYESEDFVSALKAKDIFIINNKKNSIFKFILSFKESYELYYTGIIGLSYDTNNKDLIDYNFIHQLKENKIIEKEIFFLEYKDEFTGDFIIGQFPHEYNSNKYNKKKYKEIYPKIIDNRIQIILNDISYGEHSIERLIDCVFSYEMSLLRGTSKYKEIVLNQFFNEYIKNNHCFNVTIGLLGAYIYYCDDTINITKFKPLIITTYESNITFELNYNDLFIKKGKYYFFLCYFFKSMSSSFLLGKPFFKKYMVVFNKEKKNIGFYIDDKNSTGFFRKIFPWIIFIFFLAVIFYLAFYIYKSLGKIKKKKALELIEDENPDYKRMIDNSSI